ncbi:MAG: HD domain-containing protein [Terracidiphilus sp.]|jgi:uncharacterized protein
MDANQFAPYESLAITLLRLYPSPDDGAHDRSHIERVWRNIKMIHADDGGDLELLAASVLLHDCVQAPKNSPLRQSASRLAAAEARNQLEKLHWDKTRIQAVAHAIESHSFSAGIEPQTLEAKILQDADRLDAIGLTGIARCFYTAGWMGSSLYHSADPRGNIRSLDDRQFALDHFPKKLLKLADGFQTSAGRSLAPKRQQALQAFYTGMLAEIES